MSFGFQILILILMIVIFAPRVQTSDTNQFRAYYYTSLALTIGCGITSSLLFCHYFAVIGWSVVYLIVLFVARRYNIASTDSRLVWFHASLSPRKLLIMLVVVTVTSQGFNQLLRSFFGLA